MFSFLLEMLMKEFERKEFERHTLMVKNVQAVKVFLCSWKWHFHVLSLTESNAYFTQPSEL